MQSHNRRFRILAASGVAAAAVLTTGAAANTKRATGARVAPATPTVELVRIHSATYGEIYAWTVNGVQRGVAFQ